MWGLSVGVTLEMYTKFRLGYLTRSEHFLNVTVNKSVRYSRNFSPFLQPVCFHRLQKGMTFEDEGIRFVRHTRIGLPPDSLTSHKNGIFICTAVET